MNAPIRADPSQEETPRARQRVFLDFVGCRLNQAEIERLGRHFVASGRTIASSPTEADWVVLNTCAVTGEAARKSRRLIRQAARANPTARLIVTGCYAELEPNVIAELPGVAQVLGNRDKDRLAELIADKPPLYECEPILRDPLPPGTLGRTRAFVKVQDGCDNRCTFCITTQLRGPGRSRPLAEIVDEVRLLHSVGYQEVVLTGVHLGSYGHDRGDRRGLHHLVAALLTDTAIPRIRLSSLEPWDIAPGFFDLWADSRLCPHLHLPLQSGCNATLRRMARRTTQASFAALVEAARARIPDLALTTDLMVGFPGETEAEFEESLRFVTAMDFARLHIFSYSARPGTAAARMPDQVDEAQKKERCARLRAYSEQQWRAFQATQVGRIYDVLWESARGATPEGYVWAGHTPNYLPVQVTTSALIGNTISPARIVKLAADGLWAGLCV